MDIFNKMSNTFSETGQKTKNLADIAKLNASISENERRIKQLYAEIGEIYCQTHTADPEAKVEKRVATVADLKKKNEELNKQVQGLKGMIECPNCGKMIEKGSTFCPHCGTRLPERDASQADGKEEKSAKVKYCPVCGAEQDGDAVFCTKCGTKFA